MSSNNKLIQYLMFHDTSFSVKDDMLKELVELVKNNPLEFICTQTEAFKELEEEFDAKRSKMRHLIGEVVIQLVKDGFANVKRSET